MRLFGGRVFGVEQLVDQDRRHGPPHPFNVEDLAEHLYGSRTMALVPAPDGRTSHVVALDLDERIRGAAALRRGHDPQAQPGVSEHLDRRPSWIGRRQRKALVFLRRGMKSNPFNDSRRSRRLRLHLRSNEAERDIAEPREPVGSAARSRRPSEVRPRRLRVVRPRRGAGRAALTCGSGKRPFETGARRHAVRTNR